MSLTIPDGDDDENGKNKYINRALLLAAFNKHCYDILWQCDDANGRVVYDLKQE